MQNYPITEAEGLQLLIKHCQPNDGCWLFRSRQYTFKKARRLHDYEKTANLPLPEILILQNTTINGIGIRVGNTFFEWNKIAVIGTIDQSEGGEDALLLYAILFCLNNGKIIQTEAFNTDHLHGLLGHFIAQYRLSAEQ